jgi:uncharacterized membrane protein
MAVPLSSLARTVSLALLALLFVSGGINHFRSPELYVRMMPPWIPAHLPLVYVSGVLEILGGLAVLVRPIRPWAGLGLMLLLVAIFPANLHMALNPDAFPGIPATALWVRLPLQLVLIAWAYWATRTQPGAVVAPAAA